MKTLYDYLIEYSKSDHVPLHMPGHKRNLMEFENPYGFDITEIDGFDNLHHAEGMLKEAQEYAAKVCRADETHFLVNGSTSGLLSAVFSATEQKGPLLMARNCHKAVYHAAELRQLKTHYLYPELLSEGILGEITTEMVAEAIEAHPEAKALIFTSPTYDGIISDVESIVKLAHKNGVAVIVDEAHGAHFLTDSGFPKSAICQGADVVIQSTHKTLPALTQTALIHVNKNYAYKEKLRKYLTMFQTSSPSYVLMASIDACMHWYAKEGVAAYEAYRVRLKKLRLGCETQLSCLKLITPKSCFGYDPSKVLISTKECVLTGQELHELLVKKYGIQSEMVSAEYVLFMTSVADTDAMYGRFLEALIEIDHTLEEAPMPWGEPLEFGKRKVVLSISEALEKEKKKIPLPESMGEVSAAYVSVYPPGIPLLVPGEKISERCVRILSRYLETGLEIHGLTKEQEIEILWDEYFT